MSSEIGNRAESTSNLAGKIIYRGTANTELAADSSEFQRAGRQSGRPRFEGLIIKARRKARKSPAINQRTMIFERRPNGVSMLRQRSPGKYIKLPGHRLRVRINISVGCVLIKQTAAGSIFQSAGENRRHCATEQRKHGINPLRLDSMYYTVLFADDCFRGCDCSSGIRKCSSVKFFGLGNNCE